MPGKSGKTRGNDEIRGVYDSTDQFQRRQFIQRELTADEQKACKNWSLFADRSDDMLAHWLDAGGKCTLRFDEYNRSFACWLIPSAGDSGKDGLILSGRGSTPLKAMKQCFFKHFVLFEETWPKGIDARGTIEIDD